jgi:putative membrane protein
MRLSTILLFLTGLAGLVALITLSNAALVLQFLREAGIWILPIALVHTGEYALKTLSWSVLLRGQGVRRPFRELFALRWLSDSVNSLLPAAGIGGAVVRTDLQAAQKIDGALAGAVIVVEMTVRLFTLVGFVAIGATLLLLARDAPATPLQAAGAGLAAALGVFYLLQRSGLLLRFARRVDRLTERDAFRRISGGIARADAYFPAIYGNRRALAWSAVWSFLAWIYGAIEVGFILYVTGHALGLEPLLVLESAGQAGANAGFVIPGGMGAEEGGYFLGATLVALPTAAGVAVSLVKRVRELALAVPALAGWRLFVARSAPGDEQERAGRSAATEPDPAGDGEDRMADDGEARMAGDPGLGRATRS